MKTFKFHLVDIDGVHRYAKIKTINLAQAEALVEQNFPERVSMERVTRLPRMMDQYIEDLG